MSKVEIRQALSAVSMKKEDDPVRLLEVLSGVCNRYNTATFKITNDKLIATVLEKAPKEYSTVLTCEQRAKGSNLTMKDLEEAMSQLWRTMYGKQNDKGGKEMSLASSNKVFKCYKCGKNGHKAFEQEQDQVQIQRKM